MQQDSQRQLRETQASIEDAEKRLGTRQFCWGAWIQHWPSSACGHMVKMAMQSLWDAQTVIVYGENETLVYHAGRLAFSTSTRSSRFTEAIHKRRLPGARAWQKEKQHYEASDSMDVT